MNAAEIFYATRLQSRFAVSQELPEFVKRYFTVDRIVARRRKPCHQGKRALKQTALTDEGNMERLPFEDWAPVEIARLKAEADGLSLALERYLSAVGKTAPHNGTLNKRADLVTNINKVHTVTSHEKPNQRRSKYDGLMAAFTEKSGSSGLTMDAMVNIAEEQKFEISRAQLRSLIFVQKAHKNVLTQGDLYIWGADNISWSGLGSLQEEDGPLGPDPFAEDVEERARVEKELFG